MCAVRLYKSAKIFLIDPGSREKFLHFFLSEQPDLLDILLRIRGIPLIKPALFFFRKNKKF